MKIVRIMIIAILSIIVASGSTLTEINVDKPADRLLPADKGKTVSAVENLSVEKVAKQPSSYPLVTPDGNTKRKKDHDLKVMKVKTEEKTEHVHDWEPVYETVTIDNVSSEAHEICKGCGADITEWSPAEWNEHSDAHLLAGEPAGFYEKEVKIITAVSIEKRVGYQCGSCGFMR